jgi:SagB-type dehydrogenase family enzyme
MMGAIPPLSALLVMAFLSGKGGDRSQAALPLPAPLQTGEISLEACLHERRSTRKYAPDAISLTEISQLLWAAQGVNRPGGFRTTPSAGALFPLEIYLAAALVEGIPAGVYRYLPQGHSLVPLERGDMRGRLSSAALGQESVGEGAAVLVIAAAYRRTTGKYGRRGERYVHIEVGAAAQSVHLQAAALGLGTVFIGAFEDDLVRDVIGMPSSESPLGLMPVGRRVEKGR